MNMHVLSMILAVKTVVIFPATAKHLEKYSSHESQLIHETPEDYKNILLPYVERSHFDMKVIIKATMRKYSIIMNMASN